MNKIKEFLLKPFIRSLAKQILPSIVQKEQYYAWDNYWYYSLYDCQKGIY
jgi:hypothetical protein